MHTEIKQTQWQAITKKQQKPKITIMNGRYFSTTKIITYF
jgi:hypothetical protein